MSKESTGYSGKQKLYESSRKQRKPTFCESGNKKNNTYQKVWEESMKRVLLKGGGWISWFSYWGMEKRILGTAD